MFCRRLNTPKISSPFVTLLLVSSSSFKSELIALLSTKPNHSVLFLFTHNLPATVIPPVVQQLILVLGPLLSPRGPAIGIS
jgi:hypothetical protein